MHLDSPKDIYTGGNDIFHNHKKPFNKEFGGSDSKAASTLKAREPNGLFPIQFPFGLGTAAGVGGWFDGHERPQVRSKKA